MEQAQIISRLGMFTASGIHALMSSGKKKDVLFGQTAMTYINEKIAEIITGERKQDARSASLDWGNEHEKDAFMMFRLQYSGECNYYGKENFKFFPYNEYSGGSPDGCAEDGVIEIKCPYVSSNHIDCLLNPTQEWLKTNKPEYYTQVQFNMLCTKQDKGYFVSYDPRTVDHKHRLAIISVAKDDEWLSELCMRIVAAVTIVKQAITQLS